MKLQTLHQSYKLRVLYSEVLVAEKSGWKLYAPFKLNCNDNADYNFNEIDGGHKRA